MKNGQEIKMNLSKDWYFSQRNNKERPNSACNVTSMIMALVGAGYKDVMFSKVPEGVQPEDAFLLFINNDSEFVKNWKAEYAEWLKNNNRGYLLNQPELVMKNLSICVSEWLGIADIAECAETYHTAIDYRDLKDYIKEGYGVVLAGDFTIPDGKLDHYVTLIGSDNENYYIADPWGNYKTGYKDHNGYSIQMSEREFLHKVSFCDSTKKMGIVLKPYKEA
ncbi:MAG: hypothetical protein GF311_28355 [Candidatus Lokiarchaeota archaeon]|nr:hypothetical protein [Candidatus Lokiarchaeota archaeon]